MIIISEKVKVHENYMRDGEKVNSERLSSTPYGSQKLKGHSAKIANYVGY